MLLEGNSRCNGFTLIELLVVVLIIGILAAIALPQYQVSVQKAKFTRLIPMTNSIASAQERYYLATGNYAIDMRQLDIELPASFTCGMVFGSGYCADSATKQHFAVLPTTTGSGASLLWVTGQYQEEKPSVTYSVYPTPTQADIAAINDYGTFYVRSLFISGGTERDKNLIERGAKSLGSKNSKVNGANLVFEL